MPLEGAQLIHRDWGEVKACRHRDLTRDVWKISWWALSRLQIDLRRHIGRVSGTTTLDGRDSVTLHDIIKCDEGGWVKIDELVRMDVLWSSNSRALGHIPSADTRAILKRSVFIVFAKGCVYHRPPSQDVRPVTRVPQGYLGG